jgi:glutamyl-tRNA synthetase
VPDITSTPRARFAPSPTGYLHVGNAHSALANWMFARQTGGQFLLRIEDTDAERNQPELVENVLDMLRWLGLDWDGEPVRQSDRRHLHLEAAEKLSASGVTYACDCTAEMVQARNAEQGGKPGYDGFCRDRGLDPAPGRALRFRTPDEGTTGWHDLVRGDVSFDNADLEDFVLVRSSGAPVFLLANAVDDADMGITHVIRGEDHVNGTPKYLLIQQALGVIRPEAFAHMPLLVNEGRKKLSKRRDDVSMAGYRDRGFLPEAMVNYLALLGWGPPDGVEVRPISEIVDLYRLSDVNASPAFFDLKKLTHVNGEWVRRLDPDDFIERAGRFLPEVEGAAEALRALAPLVQERVRTLDEVAGMVEFLHVAEPTMDEASWEKAMVKGKAVPEMLAAAIDELASCHWDADAIREAVEAAATTAGLVNAEGRPQLSKAQGPVRVAVSGRAVGPPLFESLEHLGRERTLQRLRAAQSRMS